MKLILNNHLSIIIFFLILNILFSSCFSQSVLTDYSIDRKIYEIEMNDGKVIKFANDSSAYLVNNEIIQTEPEGERKVYPITEVKKVYVRKFETAGTIGLLIAIPVFGTALFIIYILASGADVSVG